MKPVLLLALHLAPVVLQAAGTSPPQSVATCPPGNADCSFQAPGEEDLSMLLQKKARPHGLTKRSAWTAVWTDKYCDGGMIKHTKDDQPEGVLESKEACERQCEDNAACHFYLYRHDPSANHGAKYTCAIFHKCDSVHDFADGDGGKICQKPDTVAPTWSIVYDDKYCDSGLLEHGHLHSNQPEGVLESREACQSLCEGNRHCQYYLYRHDESARKKYTCALFHKCESVHDFADGNGGHIYQKPDTFKGPTWSIVYTDKYCNGGMIAHHHLNQPQGVLESQEACQILCEDDDSCQYYLYRHDESARKKYTCAIFHKCESVHDYDDGDGGHIYQKP